MQNQNIHPWSWGQGAAPTFPGAQPLIPTNFPPPGVDLSGYPQMYGNPPGQVPPDYGQWSAAQLQQWQQWQQWQEKYQQWQAQYGKKYAESLAALGQTTSSLLPGMPPIVGVPKPVEPVPNIPPSISNPPLPVNSQPVPPPPPDEEKPPLPFSAAMENIDALKNGGSTSQENPEELSEAEKTFDVQFKQWEGQFNEWKKQNQDHPDKAQYREYEKKWETWREQLLQRREQMRKKRLSKSNEQGIDTAGNGTGKMEESKSSKLPMPVPPPSKSEEYSYKTHAGTGNQGLFAGDPLKFENKVPFFDKDVPPGPALSSNFNQQSNKSNHEKSPNQSNFPSNNFGGFGPEKMDLGRPFPNSQGINRNQGPFRNQPPGFDGGTEKGMHNQVLNQRFGNACDGNFDMKSRHPSLEGPRFSGNFDNFGPRPRFGNEERNFIPPQRFPGDNFRNDRDFGRQRFIDTNREKELGSQGFGISDKVDSTVRVGNETNDFRSGNCPPLKQLQTPPAKPKVPSLFDITVEKPLGLPGPNQDRKPRMYEKDDYYDDQFGDRQSEGRESERGDKPWGNSAGPWGKNSGPSPWMQPWEMEKLASQKGNDGRPWDRELKKDNGPWMKDTPGKKEIDKAELSGYVGNILAKLGNFNVMLPNLTKSDNPQEENLQPGPNMESQMDLNRRQNWNKGQKSEEQKYLPSNMPPNQIGDINLRNQNRGGPPGNFERPGPRDYDHRINDFGDRLPPTNFDHLDEGRKDADERNRFDGEPKNFDVDERLTGRNDRMPFRRDFRELDPMTRNFGGPNREGMPGQRNFGNEDRFFGRDERPFGRDERPFGRFVSREDVDERFGGRNGRRGFDRFNREDGRNGRFLDRPGAAFDRFDRERESQANEPVWNPQVFDYSQGRPQKLADPDDGFKISTVVEYSHGENKQTFDYGHGGAANDRLEMRSFDYGHKTDAPTVIDYGHGVERDPLTKDCRRDRPRDADRDIDERLKPNAGNVSPIRRRSRSPRGRHRSHSRSPHSRFKRDSKSPPYRAQNSKYRDRMGRQMFKRDKNGTEDKPSAQDGDVSRHCFDVTTVLVEDLICLPGRETRPNKLVFIMRGIPGSGKTYVTKLIKDKEIELGGDPPRILSLDDYFMTEVEKEIIDKETGRKVKTKVLEYEYEAGVEPHYRGSLLKAFKKTVSDGFFSFIIVDSVNEKTKDYEEMWSFAKQKGFQVYIAEMDNDVTVCKSRNIHKRTEKDIGDLVKSWEGTPTHYLRLDVRSLLQSDAITEVEMEVVSDTELEKSIGKDEENENDEAGEEDKKEEEEEDEPSVSAFVKSRWDQFENSEQNLDRLDGLKRRREGFHATMEEYLQLPDELDQQGNSDAAPGKKRVRWADLEERRQQEKMRAIGFVVGQTDWNRMTDPTFGENALTRTKYI
ncbi:hypothetical protein RUM43_011365 [Polyplax serrata]|uniref:YLP motif-containing protein 1 n=1 Tax=Polyplax serrata TaxID=468196 RepID=A0AAN8S7U7_POLSC